MSCAHLPSILRAAAMSTALLVCAVALGDTVDLELVASDAAPGDNFGVSAAVEGDTLVVGSVEHDHDGSDSGSVYVFHRDGEGNWAEVQELLPDDTQGVEWFGISVALAGDTLVIGASGTNARRGEAYVFTRVGGVWSQQARLVPSVAAIEDRFGHAVACEGDTAVVGAPNVDGPAGIDMGAAYVFVRSGDTWTEDARLGDPSGFASDKFGYSLAIDGDTMLIGAPNTAYMVASSVHVFRRDAGSWLRDARLTADDFRADQRFGVSVALGGERFLIGESWNNAAYVLDPSPSGGWAQTRLAPFGQVGAFGLSVALQPGFIVVSAPLDDDVTPDSGAVHLLRDDSGAWTKLKTGSPGYLDWFGYRVAMDGKVLVGGAPLDDSAGGMAGAVHLYYVDGPKITTESLPDWTEGTPYSQLLASTGGVLPLRWSLESGTLPVAEGIDAFTGGIQGTALSAGNYEFVVRVADSDRATNRRSVRARLNPWPQIGFVLVPLAVQERPFSVQYSAFQGTPGHAWSVSEGQLPPGLTLAPDTGLLAGRPTEVGFTEFKARCTDSCAAATDQDVAVEVVPLVDLARKKHKQRVAFNPGDRPFTQAVELVAGTRLDVTVKLPQKEAPMTLGLLDSTQSGIDVAEWIKVKPKSIQLRRYVVGVPGRYFLVLEAVGAVTGNAKVTIKVTPPTKAKGTLSINPSWSRSFAVGALPGARVTIVVKAAKDSEAVPEIVSVLAGSAELLVPEEQRLKSTSAVLKMKTPVPGGWLRVFVMGRDGTSGSVDYKAKVKEPRKYLYSLPDTPSDL